MNGVYAVQLTENGCVDTSDCVTINTINTVSNDFKNEIQLFPNPTNKDVTIDLGSAYKNIEIVLLDLTGRKLSETSFTNNDLVNISLANQPTGTYFLQIHADGKRTMLKVVKN